MNALVLQDRGESVSDSTSSIFVVDDPVYVYFVDMVDQLAELAAGAGQASLGRSLKEAAAASRP